MHIEPSFVLQTLDFQPLAGTETDAKMRVAKVATVTTCRGFPTIKAMRAFRTGHGVKRPEAPKKVAEEASNHRFRTTLHGGHSLEQ